MSVKPATDYFGRTIPFLELCGVRALSKEKGRTRLRVTAGPEHDNSFGRAHGGLIMTLLDVAMGSAARSVLGDEARIMTLNMQTQFLEAAMGELTAEGRVVRAGKTLIYCEGDVRDAEGRLLARASGSFMPFIPKKARAEAAS